MTDSHAQNIETTELSWLNEQHGMSLPYRGDFSDLNQDYQFILELGDDGVVRMRNVGLFVEGLFGASIAGRSFSSLFSDTHRAILDRDLSGVFNEPAKVYVDAISSNEEVEFGLFPVSEDYGPVSYALGAVSLDKMPSYSVYTLGVRKLDKYPLREEKKELKYGFAEDSAGFHGAPSRGGFQVITGSGGGNEMARPGLRLIQNVKREP